MDHLEKKLLLLIHQNNLASDDIPADDPLTLPQPSSDRLFSNYKWHAVPKSTESDEAAFVIKTEVTEAPETDPFNLPERAHVSEEASNTGGGNTEVHQITGMREEDGEHPVFVKLEELDEEACDQTDFYAGDERADYIMSEQYGDFHNLSANSYAQDLGQSGSPRKKSKKEKSEKPHKCDICLKSFTSRGHLTEHLRVHSGEKPFSCDICLQKFQRASHLRRHSIMHSGVKPYTCEICRKSFTRTAALKKHQRLHYM